MGVRIRSDTVALKVGITQGRSQYGQGKNETGQAPKRMICRRTQEHTDGGRKGETVKKKRQRQMPARLWIRNVRCQLESLEGTTDKVNRSRKKKKTHGQSVSVKKRRTVRGVGERERGFEGRVLKKTLGERAS